MDGNWFEFVAMQGIQARQAFYVIMVPLQVVPKFFKFDDESLPPQLRAQRTLNKNRIPQLTKYILDNPNEYLLSSLCACVDGEVNFEPSEISQNIGRLKISMDATVLINDGQHRREAIQQAVKQSKYLGSETISVVLYADQGLKRSQQMFADLNMHAVKPAQSIKLLYNHRDEQSYITKIVIEQVPLFKEFTDFEKTSLSNRTTKLFTFSSLHQATKDLLSHQSHKTSEEKISLAQSYWNEIIQYIPGWLDLLDKRVSACHLRNEYVHSHGITIQAFARLGNILLTQYSHQWKSVLPKLISINWSRHNQKTWAGRMLNAGKITKSKNTIILVTNYLQNILAIPLAPEAQEIENQFLESILASQKAAEEMI